MNRLGSLFACLCALSVSTAAHADTLQSFAFSGTYVARSGSTPNGTASGDLVIDITNGLIQTVDLTYSGFTVAESDTSFLQDVSLGQVEITDAITDPVAHKFSSITLFLPVGTLVGYTGGSICSTANSCFQNSYFLQSHFRDQPFIDGQLSAIPAVPEPSSLLLLGTGCLGIMAALRRKNCSQENN